MGGVKDIPGYRIDSLLSQNEATLVYRASKETENLSVVLKLPRSDYPAPETIAAFEREFDLLRKFSHEGVIRVHAREKCGNRPILVLEDFGGVSLQSLVSEGPLAIPLFLSIASDTARILSFIHEAGIIHRDVNPANMVYSPESGILKLIDFGLAISRDDENKAGSIPVGTLAYISPEQTGRMNCALDFRTDLYAAGATFYELLTGSPPFKGKDPLELVHCHIARPAVPPHRLRQDIPEYLSLIVMKLLEKNADERYRSAKGLLSDLTECGQRLGSLRGISSDLPGEKEIPDRVPIPFRHYGRKDSFHRLKTAFEGVCSSGLLAGEGWSEMIFVSGDSGMGKTMLIRHFQEETVKNRGYFIEGSFDRFRTNIPYTAFVEAFSHLVRRLLMESEERLEKWQDRLKSALGAGGSVLADMIPRLERLIGEQSSIDDLRPDEVQNRLHVAFLNFIRVFGDPEEPLIIFLDDLQWADQASLDLIRLMASADDGRFLFIGAFRLENHHSKDPLAALIKEVKAAGVRVSEIVLGPLSVSDTASMLSDALERETGEVRTLAAVIHGKTGGNPFFFRAFLRKMSEEKGVYFDETKGRWEWDERMIETAGITDNAVRLMIEKILALPPEIRDSLQTAACIGIRFDSGLLARISGVLPVHILPYLCICVRESLLIEERKGSVFLFSHEQIRDAAYTLLPDEKKWETHRRIARTLLEESSPEKSDRRIFDIVNQLNAGMPRPYDFPDEERWAAAEYNNMAGKRAKSAAAFGEAFSYLKKGVELLPGESWDKGYALRLSLSEELAEASCLCGDYDLMEEMFTLVCKNASSVLDMVKVYEVRLQAYSMRSRFREAVETGLGFSKMLGFPLPLNPGKRQVYAAFFRTWILLKGRNIEDLALLPGMNHPHMSAAMRILSSTASSAFLSDPMVYPLTILRRVEMSVRYGNEAYSAYTYAAFGIILCGVAGDIDAGYRFGKLALILLEKFEARFLTAKIYLVVNIFIRHWKEHLRETLSQLKEGYRSGLETGDLEFGYFCIQGYCMHCLFAGKSLPGVEREAARFVEEVDRVRLKSFFYYGRIHHQVILNLMDAKGASGKSWTLSGESYDENEMMPFHRNVNDRLAIFWVYLNRLWLSCLFDQDEKALEYADLAGEVLDAAKSLFVVPVYHFYDALARIRALPGKTFMEGRRLRAKVAADLRKLRKWSRHAPMNHRHRHDLVLAEYYRVRGRHKKAMIHYEKAFEGARENAYTHDEALAAELAARFYMETHKKGIWGPKGLVIAQSYLKDALYAYRRWGAEAKLRQLEARFELTEKTKVSIYDTDRGGGIGETLDIGSVMAAAQAISGEIVPNRLLKRLLTIVMENAGAQKGYLILKDDAPIRINTGDKGSEGIGPRPSIRNERDLPLSMVQYVTRTHESVVIQDASAEGLFTRDPYIMEECPKSVLCMPIIRHGTFMGILYLENSRIAGAFTPERMKILEMLVSQAAISIDNARLYDKYRSLFENALEGLFLCGKEGRFQDVNPAFVRLLGFETKAELFSLFPELKPLFISRKAYESVAGILKEKGSCVGMEILMRRRDGKPVWISFSGRVIPDMQERSISYEGSIVDISERKILETQRERQQEQLEGLVKERTAALTAANLQLNVSIRVEQFRAWGMSLLNIMNDILFECRTEKDTYEVLLDTCRQLFESDSGCLWILDGEGSLKTVFSWGNFPEEDFHMPKDSCPIFRKGRFRPHVFSERTDRLEGLLPFCMPLKGQAEPLGVFSIHFCMPVSESGEPDEQRRFVELKRNMAVRLGEQYALLLLNLRLREKLRLESIHDPLTGLYNRRHMEKSLEREVGRCIRRKTHLGIILFDIDHFKRFNDTYGHALGDQVLSALGRYLREHSRTEDIVCRYGGEEFLMIMPGSPLMSTAGRALEIREGIRKIRVRSGEESIGCTISVGVAGFPDHGIEIDKVLASADQALYRAKEEGRDRVVIAEGGNENG